MGDNGLLYDVVVVGAGVEGSSTAYHLARAGQKTLLIDQFVLPHTRGSSHGASRVYWSVFEKPVYANMMPESYQGWEELAHQSQTKLSVKTGLLCVSPKEVKTPAKTIEKNLSERGAVYRPLDAAQLRKDFPMLSFPDNYCAVLDPEAGILFADKCVNAFQRQFERFGGIVRDGEPVTSVIPGEKVTVITTESKYKCRSVVLTAGPWSSKLLRPLGLNLPLKPVKLSVCFLAEKQRGVHAVGNFPIVGFYSNNYMFWGMPSLEYPGFVKGVVLSDTEIDPDRRDLRFRDAEKDVFRVEKMIKNHMPGLEAKASVVEFCICTFTPDEDFILDTHPHCKNIVIGAGFSGNGFMLAPVVGKVLSELAMGQVTSYDLTQFRINRFFPGSDKARL